MWNMPQVERHGSLCSVCDLGCNLSEFCTRTFQKWHAIIYSVLCDRIIYSACAAVSCTLCLYVGDSLEVVALCCYRKLSFPIWTKIFSILFNVQKNGNCLSFFFFKSPFDWGFIFLFLFVCFCFCNAASSKACWELSDHSASCFMGTFFLLTQKAGGKGGRSVHGIVIKCLLYLLSCDISIAKPVVFFKHSFWLWYS